MQYSPVDWKDLNSVMRYAESLGRGMTVFKNKTRATYNITHTSRADRWDIADVEVVYTT